MANLQKPVLDTTPLTFGIEMEFVFGFHSEELNLADGVTNHPYSIRKDLSYRARSDRHLTRVNPSKYPRRVYNSWGLKRKAEPKILAYETQPQEIVKRILDKQCPEIASRIEGTMLPVDKTEKSYDKWIVTVDHSVCGVGSKNIPKWLPKKVAQVDAEHWDSYGIEIVSPVLKTDESAYRKEISKITDALHGNAEDKYGAFITNQCSLHVHVQAPTETEVFEQLAILLLIYEEEISRLHPAIRRPEHPASKLYINSNRLALVLEQDQGHINTADCSTAALQQRNITIQHIQEAIEQGHHIQRPDGTFIRAPMSRKQLAAFMNYPLNNRNPLGDRNRLVNFTCAVRPNAADGQKFAKTIEFRQAGGSLDKVLIERWVEFCVQLMRLAAFYAKNEERRVRSWDESYEEAGEEKKRIDVFCLLEEMGLDEQAILFWRQRVEMYRERREGSRDDVSDDEDIPFDDEEGHCGYEDSEDTDNEDRGDSSDDNSDNNDDNDDDRGHSGGGSSSHHQVVYGG
ncbi:hypothetical protein B7494_g7261 [Chlorociboria aeruginascens]|nr:hypothetical protein B7494_g7261 [Chlorociboria aeruginascens]